MPSRGRQHVHGQGHTAAVMCSLWGLPALPPLHRGTGKHRTARSFQEQHWNTSHVCIKPPALSSSGPHCTLTACWSWQAFPPLPKNGGKKFVSVGGHGWYQFCSLTTSWYGAVMSCEGFLHHLFAVERQDPVAVMPTVTLYFLSPFFALHGLGKVPSNPAHSLILWTLQLSTTATQCSFM